MAVKVKKFFAFEGLMFLVFGVFWAACTFLPLFLTGAIQNKQEFLKNMVIMWGPYSAYLGIRCVFLFGKSLIWAYLISNFFFTSEWEKRLAGEWLVLNKFFFVWFIIISYPLYLMGNSAGWKDFVMRVGFILLPYFIYLIYRFVLWFLRFMSGANQGKTKIE